MRSFILVFLTLISLQLFATGQEPLVLEWQSLSYQSPLRESSEQQAISTQFRALPASGNCDGEAEDDATCQRQSSDRGINGKLQITGHPFQVLTLCAKQTEIDTNDSALLAVSETAHVTTVILRDGVANFSISSSSFCPKEAMAGKAYHWRRTIYSDQTFLVTRKLNDASPKSPDKNKIFGFPASGSLFPDKELNELGVGYGSGFGGGDEDDPFQKRPPFMPMPMPAKGEFSLTLLPVLRLTKDWRQYLLGTQWWHWLVGEPEQGTGITLHLRHEGRKPLVLQVSQSEFNELSEHLLNTRQLLQWLAPKLNGRETFIQQLLKISDSIPNTNQLWHEETRHRIQQQLMVVLEQPDTEFSLQFETHLLADSLSGWSQEATPETGIIQLPKGKDEGQSGQLPTGQGEQQPSEKKQASDRHPDQAGNMDQGNNGEGSRQPRQPSGAQSLSDSGAQTAEDNFTIVVNRVRFKISKDQLSPSQRGQEEASSIKAHNPENPAVILPLNEIEAVVGVPEEIRLSKYNNSALNYLLQYGTWVTKTALKKYYPVNLISEHKGHLKAEISHLQDYSVDAICQVCREPLLSQHSITACHYPANKHAFHTSCLSQRFSKSQAETWCPFCQEGLSPNLFMLLSKGLESELHHATASSNHAVVKALLEVKVKVKVNVDTEDANGNTPFKTEALQCFMCSTKEKISTVNGLTICDDCLHQQAEQSAMYEDIKQPEQKDPQINLITSSIYLGNYDFASDKEKLHSNGITSILVCGSSLKQYFPDDFNYHQIPLEDKTEQDISKFFAEAWDFIEGELSKSPDSRIFVHCYAGVSRSSSIVISYLMKKFNMKYQQAFDVVKMRRPSIYPNEAFVLQLKDYGRFLEQEELYRIMTISHSTSYYSRECLRYQKEPFENSHSQFEFNLDLTVWGVYCDKNRNTRRQNNYRIGRYIPAEQIVHLQNAYSCQISSDTAPDSYVQVYIIKESVTHFECDAVVNAAKESLLGGGGVDHAIHRGAGSNLVRECAYLNGCKVGEAKITKGYDLPAKYVLHTVAPILSGLGVPDESALISCYQSCFSLCDEYQLKTIAIPCIGCGFYGFRLDKSAAVVRKTLQKYVDSAGGEPTIRAVILSVFDDEQFDIYRKAFQ